ncbi:hypothetical protein KIN20_005469 [Parelaphostrongylus tenuis]|uniref:Uncharacterized protein n=1 Tax=Parelaphostrongylus tenuis TaxID=148309 RepID=A0AAD5MLA1_PARTN|nr:hypothetical protein KIN20_005469 [Parelaphostrongylus tenuis]
MEDPVMAEDSDGMQGSPERSRRPEHLRKIRRRRWREAVVWWMRPDPHDRPAAARTSSDSPVMHQHHRPWTGIPIEWVPPCIE